MVTSEVPTTFEIGSFLLEAPIGEGGVCQVWRGVHRQRHFPIALKVLLRDLELSSARLDAFQAEVRSMAGLDHPAIVRLFDYGTIDADTAREAKGALRSGSPYLVMELAEGSLAPLCGALEWESFYRLLMSLLDALAHAHARGVIHRDIKPDNVLTFDGGATVKLTDFGLAFGFEQDEIPAYADGLRGTPLYMAPEQFSGSWRDYGPWTDMYGLGATAYELLSGQAPFAQCNNLSDLMMAHLSQPPPPCFSSFAYPDAFDGWLQRMLAKAPGERFQRAADAACTLARIHSSWRKLGLHGRSTGQAAPEGPDGVVLSATIAPQAERTIDESTGTSTLAAVRQATALLHLKTLASAQDWDQVWGSEFAVENNDASEALGPSDASIGAPEPMLQAYQDLSLPSTWRQPEVERSEVCLHIGLGLHGFRTIPFVDRDQEREALWQLFGEVARHKQARCVVIQGEAGCGKSRLADWLCHRTHELGLSTPLRAFHRSVGGEKDGLAAMLARYLGCSGLGYLETLAQLRRRLAHEDALDEQDLCALAELMSPATEQEREEAPRTLRFCSSHERYQVLYRFLKVLSRQRLVIVWFDDVHWALDALDFVRYAMNVQQVEPLPVLFLLTAQSDDKAQRTYEKVCFERLRVTATDRLTLGPLEASHRGALIRNIMELAPELARQVEGWTVGHPMFATQLLEHWVRMDWLVPSPEGFCLQQERSFRQPSDLLELWGDRLAHLLAQRDPDERAALELAALLGQSIDHAEWMEACEAFGVEVPHELVKAMLEQRLLIQAEEHSGKLWIFVNETIRAFLEAQARLSPRWSRYCEICARILRKSSERGADERLGRLLLRAGQKKAALAPLLRAIRDYISRGEDSLAWALFREWEEALSTARIPNHDPLWGSYYFLQFKQHSQASALEEAMRWSEQAEEEARAHGWRDTLLELLCERANLYWTSGLLAEAWDGLEEARQLAQELDHTTWLAEVHLARGTFLKFRGQLEEAAAELEASNVLFTRLAEPLGIGRSLWRLGVIYKQQGDLANAAAYAQQAQACFERWGARTLMAHGDNLQGEVARMQGDLQRAEIHYRSAISQYQTLRAKAELTCRLNLVLLCLEQERYQAAYEQLQDCLAVEPQRLDQVNLGICECSLLSCFSAWGEWDAWDRHFARGTERLQRLRFCDVDLARIMERTAEHCVDAGHTSRALAAFKVALGQYETLHDAKEVQRITSVMRAVSAD